MYYNMNDIDVRSSNNFLRKVFLFIIYINELLSNFTNS